MSRFTTQVRYICENACGLEQSLGYDKVGEILTIAAPKVFDFDYPIFDEKYRIPLERKILLHYYTREISEETVSLWKLRLWDKLNLIMPYYNQLYLSELIKYNPLYDVDITTDHKKNNEGNEQTRSDGVRDRNSSTTIQASEENDVHVVTDGSTTENNTNTDLYNETPQGGMGWVDPQFPDDPYIRYLTNARKVQDNGGSTNEQETTTDNDKTTNSTSAYTDNETTNNNRNKDFENTEDYIEHVRGKRSLVSNAKMIKEFRENFLNIDKMVIDELSDLFFGLWE